MTEGIEGLALGTNGDTPYTVEQISQNPKLLKKLSAAEQTDELCLAAVQAIGTLLRFVARQTPAICLAAVQEDGYALRFVKQQTPEISLAAVTQDGCALELVHEQTLDLRLAAVRNNGTALEFVELPYDKIEVLSFGQLEMWCAILRACEQTDDLSVGMTLLPLMQSIPLGRQYCDEWCQSTTSGMPQMDRLIELVNEVARLAPREPTVTELLRRISRQQEWILRRQWKGREAESLESQHQVEKAFSL